MADSGDRRPSADDLRAVPSRLETPSDYRGPRQNVVVASAVVASLLVIAGFWGASRFENGASNGAAVAAPITLVTPEPDLQDDSRGGTSGDPIVIADPTSEPTQYHFDPHFRTVPLSQRHPATTRVEIHQTATVPGIAPQLTPEEQALAARSRSGQSAAPPSSSQPDSVIHLDQPSSQDAQAAADLAASVLRQGTGAQVAQTTSEQQDVHAEREQFLHASGHHVGYAAATSPDELWATTTITCRLETEINSELPGIVRARVTMPVYDSKTHDHIVIPAGTIVQGTYDSHVIGGQSRLLVAWQRLYFPDGQKFDMGVQEGADAAGAAGLEGRVDNHTGQIVRTGLLMTLFGIATALLNPPASILTTQSIGSQIGQAAGGEVSQLGNRVASRQLEQGPTIRVAPPYEFHLMLLNDLPLQRYAVE